MKCNKCRSVTVVTDSRRCPILGGHTKRKRKCNKCGNEFITFELRAEGLDDISKKEARKIRAEIKGEIKALWEKLSGDMVP